MTSPNAATDSENHCAPAGARLHRQRHKRQIEHHMRGHDTDKTARELRDNIKRDIGRRQFAAQSEDDRHDRIEMRAGHRRQDRDEDHKRRACCKRIGQKRQRDIARQRLGHDARADNGGDQDRRSQRLGDQTAWQIRGRHQTALSLADVEPARRPISRSARAQRGRVDCVDRQGRQRGDAVLNETQRGDEGGFLLAIRALDGGGIFDAPMRRHRMARPDRTGLAGRAVANREHEIHHRRIGTGKFSPAFERRPSVG